MSHDNFGNLSEKKSLHLKDSFRSEIIMTELQPKDSTYSFENDTLLQKIEIVYISNNEIRFKILSKNAKRNLVSTIEGIAKRGENTDLEIDEDEDGISYPSVEYVYEEGCRLSIRIEMERKEKVRIIEFQCERMHSKSCPFTSIGLLKKKSAK
jgi:hypothetical protein